MNSLLHPVSHVSVTFHFIKSGQTSFTKPSFCKFKDMDIKNCLKKGRVMFLEGSDFMPIRSLFNHEWIAFQMTLVLVSLLGHFCSFCP